MKKLAVFAFVLVICCLSAPVTASALVPDNLNASSSKIITEGINNVAEDQAEMFKGLGLFLGTDKGFELYRRLTRAEAAALIVRFMGEEKNALAQHNKHPFRDVPAWADPYLGWLNETKEPSPCSETKEPSPCSTHVPIFRLIFPYIFDIKKLRRLPTSGKCAGCGLPAALSRQLGRIFLNAF